MADAQVCCLHKLFLGLLEPWLQEPWNILPAKQECTRGCGGVFCYNSAQKVSGTNLHFCISVPVMAVDLLILGMQLSYHPDAKHWLLYISTSHCTLLGHTLTHATFLINLYIFQIFFCSILLLIFTVKLTKSIQ